MCSLSDQKNIRADLVRGRSLITCSPLVNTLVDTQLMNTTSNKHTQRSFARFSRYPWIHACEKSEAAVLLNE